MGKCQSTCYRNEAGAAAKLKCLKYMWDYEDNHTGAVESAREKVLAQLDVRGEAIDEYSALKECFLLGSRSKCDSTDRIKWRAQV